MAASHAPANDAMDLMASSCSSGGAHAAPAPRAAQCRSVGTARPNALTSRSHRTSSAPLVLDDRRQAAHCI
jgi:hypothetical protein